MEISTTRSTLSGSDETSKLLGSLDVMQSALRARDEKDADSRGQIAAIGRSQAVIEFDMNGTVREVNENFARVLGLLPRRSDRQASQHVRRGILCGKR